MNLTLRPIRTLVNGPVSDKLSQGRALQLRYAWIRLTKRLPMLVSSEPMLMLQGRSLRGDHDGSTDTVALACYFT